MTKNYGKHKTQIDTACDAIYERFLAKDYDWLENISQGNRLNASDMQKERDEYGGTLRRPAGDEKSKTVVYKLDGKNATFHIFMPFFMEEEGLSDQEVQFEITFLSKEFSWNFTQLHILGILVP
jgi:hypothetical protein